MRNLSAQIQGRRRARPATDVDRAALIEFLVLRGHTLGLIADTQSAAAEADSFVIDQPNSAHAHVARAHTLATFHRFSDANEHFERALSLGADTDSVHSEQAALLEAIGDYDRAEPLRRAAFTKNNGFAATAGLAAHHAARGDLETAESHYDRARELFRGLSPFPLATLDFHRGHLWLSAGEHERAAEWFTRSVRRLPEYLPAQGHLAAAEVCLGNTDSAITRLRHAVTVSDDPEYAGQLAQLLIHSDSEEARMLREGADARYEQLLRSHPEAFADHAAALWLSDNSDPERVLQLARLNYRIRPTQRAADLLRQAIDAVCPRAASERVERHAY
ncbi:tetratricopeptide repeat protein [Nocardia sp. FBN12]|uniref:tetratricopeptide repeat protein n=1 Tax=Nocardia sp. FBN12 TaxID=3419766 RepID=UPI003D071B5E